MPPIRRNLRSNSVAVDNKENDAPQLIKVAVAVDQKEVAAATDTTASSSKRSKVDKPKYDSLWDVVLEGEDDDDVPVYDDCDDIRRKIRALQKEPGHKIAHWVKAIGNVNSNSLRQFMKLQGLNRGAGNKVYYRAYIYFEKRRIFERKKKSAKRLDNEDYYPDGFNLKTDTQGYIIGPGFTGFAKGFLGRKSP